MILVDKALQAREQNNNPIRVGIVGAGYMAVGLINQIERYVPGMWVAAVSNRNPERARQCFLQAGVKQIAIAHDPQQLDNHIRARQHSVCDHPEVLCFSEEIDIIVEATGTIDFAGQYGADGHEPTEAGHLTQRRTGCYAGPYPQALRRPARHDS